MTTENVPTAQRLATAIEELEKLTRISAQLPARLEAAKAAVVEILDELGIEAKPAKRAKRPPSAAKARRAGAGPYVPPEGSMSEAIFRHLPGSIAALAGALEEPNLRKVSGTLGLLERHGHVVADRSTVPPIYRAATEADRSALQAAALDAAGVEAEAA